jgi:hypothetical protein
VPPPSTILATAFLCLLPLPFLHGIELPFLLLGQILPDLELKSSSSSPLVLAAAPSVLAAGLRLGSPLVLAAAAVSLCLGFGSPSIWPP